MYAMRVNPFLQVPCFAGPGLWITVTRHHICVRTLVICQKGSVRTDARVVAKIGRVSLYSIPSICLLND